MAKNAAQTAGKTRRPPEIRKRLYSVADVAAMGSFGSRTLYRWVDAGKMPAPIRIGSSVRFRAEEIDRWFDEGCPGCHE